MRIFTVIFLFLFLPAVSSATVWFVPGKYPTIQETIFYAAGGDTIYVNPGTYRENLDFMGKTLTVKSYLGPTKTTIDGTMSGTVVLFANGEGPGTVLEGFTITNGSGTFEPDWCYYGGGIYCKNETHNCFPTIKGNIITANTADFGAGIYCDLNCSPDILGNTISYNTAQSNGGGIGSYDGSTPDIIDNVFLENQASFGGGIRCHNNAAPNIKNCLFVDNRASKGGGMSTAGSSPFVNNCTFAGNTSGGSNKGGGICIDSGGCTVENSILWDNVPDGFMDYTGAATVSYCDIQTPAPPGVGVICSFPFWVTGPNGNHYLSQTASGQAVNSPCLNTGNPASVMITGSTRTDEAQDAGIVDMGFHFPLAGAGPIKYVPRHFPTIQAAINAAAFGDTIIVSPGTYTENINFIGKPITVMSEFGPYLTSIDGGQAGPVVTFVSDETEWAVLEGFTITNGKASIGGGIYASRSEPTITRNVIEHNFSTANYGGGGIYAGWSDATITYNIISENDASVSGGGIRVEHCSPLIFRNVICRNTAEDGGGICGDTNTGVMEGNVVIGNTASRSGGGILCGYRSSALLVDNVVAQNSAGSWGGGIYMNYSSDAKLVNNTIADNTASSGGGVLCYSASPTMENSIVWDNSAATGPEICLMSGSTLSIDYSDVLGGQSSVHVESGSSLLWGVGNMATPPGFVDPIKGDYHLKWTSSCRDRGWNMAACLPAEDFEGDPRIASGTPDMGADEFDNHLYRVGSVVSGGPLEIKIVGSPGSKPVALGMSTGIQDPPQPTPHGDLHLKLPLVGFWPVGSIPSSGVLALPVTVPVAWKTGDRMYFQALFGNWGFPSSRLTNLMVFEVE
jgi:parallel beta-helix repeat protein